MEVADEAIQLDDDDKLIRAINSAARHDSPFVKFAAISNGMISPISAPVKNQRRYEHSLRNRSLAS